MNTVEKRSTGVTPADLILSHAIRLTSHIMSPVGSGINSSDTSLSDRMDEWISRQHTLLVVAEETQLQSNRHKVVENPINWYVLYTPPINLHRLSSIGMCYIHHQWVLVTSYFPNIEVHIKL